MAADRSETSHAKALERWLRYEREVHLANTAHLALSPPNAPPECHYPTVAFPIDELRRFRAAYVLLRNAVADFLDLDPETMTQLQVIGAMAQRHWKARKKEEEEKE
jgi:hypothetical protein